MVREAAFPGVHARHSVCAWLCGLVANGYACAVLAEARLAFWARLRQRWQGGEVVGIGCWPRTGARVGALWRSLGLRGDAHRTMVATAGAIRKVGGLKRALVDTVRGS
jgi:hypothetical protein